MVPGKQGLYHPQQEHDACGVGFIAHIKGHKRHDIIAQGLQLLTNLTHRGATGADPLTGDGAGILTQLPDALLRREFHRLGVALPPEGAYGIGMLFLPRQAQARSTIERTLGDTIEAEGLILLGWRDVPTRNTGLSTGVKAVEPVVRQVAVGSQAASADPSIEASRSVTAAAVLWARSRGEWRIRPPSSAS